MADWTEANETQAWHELTDMRAGDDDKLAGSEEHQEAYIYSESNNHEMKTRCSDEKRPE